MYFIPEAFPGIVVVRAGILDQGDGEEDPLEIFKPKVEAFTSKRASWLKGVEGCVQFEEALEL